MSGPSPAGVPTVAVRGSWTTEVPPELARVRVAVGAVHRDRAQALRDLSRRVEDVRTTLAGYGAAVESVESGPLWVRPQFRERRPTERVTGYLGSALLTAVLVDFTVAGDLVLRLADRDMATLEGPFWELRPDSDVHRRARTEAVRDARRRAEEYAAAAGSRLTGLVEIADTGLSAAGDVHPPAAPFALARSARGSVADEVDVDVEPVPQTVSASVEARFTMAQPQF
jgi:uncharacterized protein YggE